VFGAAGLNLAAGMNSLCVCASRAIVFDPHRHQVKEQLIYQEMGSPFRIAC
jgi:hypothetical protein